MVEVGFTPPDVTTTLPSTTNRFFTSWDRPHSFTTERSGSTPIRAVPSRCQAIDTDIGRPGGGKNFPGPCNAVFEHARAVLADRIVDARRRDAMAVLEDGIERDAVVLLRQVLADRRQAEPVAIKPAERGVVARPPRQQALGLAGNGLRHRSDAAAELKGVATHETARRIGIVELFAPETGRRRAIAVGRLVHITVGLSVGMEHQVLADQSAGIGKPVL